MEGYVGNWWFFYAAFAYFMYRLFDELDGKQARRTKNSSVLGMLLDHGCDSFACIFCCLFGLKAFGVGANLVSFFALTTVHGAFLFIVFEEYYKGYFKLGPGNGVSDASLLVYVLFIFTGIVG